MSYRVPSRQGFSPLKTAGKIIIVLLVAAILSALAFLSFYNNGLKPVGGSQEEVVITVDDGDTYPIIGASLKKADLIRNETVFNLYTRLNGSSGLKAGTYKMNKQMSVKQIIGLLEEGKVATDMVTILPGKSVKQIKQELIRAGFKENEVEAALNPSLYGSHPVFSGMNLPSTLDGFIYPESFIIDKSSNPEQIVRLALDEMSKKLTSELRAGLMNRGLSVYDGIILASIVENEVSDKNPDDRPKAAQVFLKRLETGMMLQSNATDDFPPEYDTYNILGLPPTPISNVTISSLEAVASPSNTDYLYFVSGKDCVTRFSRTITEHEALIAQHGVATAGDNCR